MSFESLLKDKEKRLEKIPLAMQSVLEKQQSKILKQIISELNTLTTVDGKIKIDAANLKKIAKISDDLKSIFLTKDYLNGVKEFAKEFNVQAALNNKIIKAGFGVIEDSVASSAYIEIAKKSAIDALVGSGIDKEFIKPIQGLLESAVVNGATFGDTIESISQFVNGNAEDVSRIAKYARQITNDSFSIADASYTSIVSDALGAEWFYYSGTTIKTTRCFCKERVGNFYHYKEIEAWGEGKNLGNCDLGDGFWAGEIDGTNAATIFSYRGGYNCLHFFMPVTIDIVPESDQERARSLGFID